jgi:hypothetical protein
MGCAEWRKKFGSFLDFRQFSREREFPERKAVCPVEDATAAGFALAGEVRDGACCRRDSERRVRPVCEVRMSLLGPSCSRAERRLGGVGLSY